MANKIYINPEATTTFAPSGGDVTFTVENGSGADGIEQGEGKVSARHDIAGAADVGTARSEWYEWRAKTAFDTGETIVVGETIDIYLCTSDGTIEDGNIGTADADLTNADVLPNLHYIGSMVVEDTTAGNPRHASGICRIASRYVSVVWWNNSAAGALSTTAGDHSFILKPIPPEAQ